MTEIFLNDTKVSPSISGRAERVDSHFAQPRTYAFVRPNVLRSGHRIPRESHLRTLIHRRFVLSKNGDEWSGTRGVARQGQLTSVKIESERRSRHGGERDIHRGEERKGVKKR